jgi:hypothetical protein
MVELCKLYRTWRAIILSIDQHSNPFSKRLVYLDTFQLLLRNTPYCAELEVQSLSLLEVKSHERSNGSVGSRASCVLPLWLSVEASNHALESLLNKGREAERC